MSTPTRYLRKHFLLATFVSAILLVAGWYGVRVGIGLYEFNDTFNVSLAEDAQTDKYLGEVISDVRDSQTGEVVIYRIRLNSGDVIERCAESVRVFKP